LLNSLVAYRGKYAKIVSESSGKFEIEIDGGKTAKVREKDLRFLAPKFEIPKANLTPDFEILGDLSEEVLSIEELSNWLFDEYSASSSWQVFQLVEDGLLFYWQKDKIFIRPKEQVEKIKEAREFEKNQELALKNFLINVENKTFGDGDLEFLREIEKVALNQLKSSKILKTLKIANTPQDAHKFLIDIGFWNLTKNPYPTRNKIRYPQDLEITEQKVERTDLTHFVSYAIDNAGSNDADDAIAIVDDKIWISIADVGSFADEGLLAYAQDRVSNLYLPNEIIQMLPEIITEKCALNGESNALSIGFKISENCDEISEIEVVKSNVLIENTTYDDIDDLLTNSQDNKFTKFNDLANSHKKYRKNCGSFNLDLPKVDVKLVGEKVELTEQKNTTSRLMVAEFMILAGRVISQFATENEIAIPFVAQEKGNFSDELLAKEKLLMSESFASTKLFKRSKTGTIPSLHFGLGLDKYTRVTSPLRRYLDLITHCQLSNFIAKKEIFSNDEVVKIIGENNANLQKIGLATRESNNHYKFLYILQNKNQTFEAQIISNLGNKKLIMILELGMIQAVKTELELDEKVQVKFYDVDIFNLELSVKIIK
jgi:exoribonuclease-2